MGGAKIIVVANVDGQLCCLYLCAGDSMSWTIPGGGMEPQDSNPEACAKRELEEEAGITGHLQKIKGPVFLHVYEGDPLSYTSPRQKDPHDNSGYEGPEHIGEIWVPLDQMPGEYIKENQQCGAPPRGRCDMEWQNIISPMIDRVRSKCMHLVEERYSLKARLL
tara:strand:- start:240 stop:731 length:492 start_codon:yes stop_codon:yes gene_type:complete